MLSDIASGRTPNGNKEYEILNFRPMTYSQNLLLANQIKWELWNGEKFVYKKSKWQLGMAGKEASQES
jgi:hypothetical protein